MKKFVKKEVLEKNSLTKIDVMAEDNLILPQNIELPFAVSECFTRNKNRIKDLQFKIIL